MAVEVGDKVRKGNHVGVVVDNLGGGWIVVEEDGTLYKAQAADVELVEERQ